VNYEEIKDTALQYSDRTDADIVTKMDAFLRIVESRINRNLRIMQMSTRSIVLTVDEQHYFGLPSLFAGVRDIEVREKEAVKGQTCVYASPEQMNSKSVNDGCIYYTIVANQIQLFPPQDDKVLEIIYYQRLTPLSTEDDTNWLSDRYPDVYVFALLVEIGSFVKNAAGAQLWNERMSSAITEIQDEDAVDRWSGSALTIKVG